MYEFRTIPDSEPSADGLEEMTAVGSACRTDVTLDFSGQFFPDSAQVHPAHVVQEADCFFLHPAPLGIHQRPEINRALFADMTPLPVFTYARVLGLDAHFDVRELWPDCVLKISGLHAVQNGAQSFGNNSPWQWFVGRV